MEEYVIDEFNECINRRKSQNNNELYVHECTQYATSLMNLYNVMLCS